MSNLTGTIASISTPLESGAISIVRMSGDDAIKIADKVFKTKKGALPSTFAARTMMLGQFSADNFCEQCLAVVFKAPNSFTGEDMVEFQCHGGVMITKGILSTLLKNGARLATPGEFSRRAFVNGKMSLSDAEGMMDMINAQSEAEIRAGYSLLTGSLSKLAKNCQEKLIDVLSNIEVSLDYPEEDIEEITKQKTKQMLEEICEKLNDELSTHSAGKLIKEGVNVAILGKPNVGKSSLLNALLKDEKAIVTPIAGTTRDVIEGSILINGLRFNFFDTAGIRETADEVEKIGVDRAKNVLASCDLVLCLTDSKKPDEELEKLISGKPCIIVFNKSDLTNDLSFGENSIHISALKNLNIDKLEEMLYAFATAGKNFKDGLIIVNERHYNALMRARNHLVDAIAAINDYSLDIVTIDLNLAYSALGEITGNTSSEDIIDAIFSKFCLGK